MEFDPELLVAAYALGNTVVGYRSLTELHYLDDEGLTDSDEYVSPIVPPPVEEHYGRLRYAAGRLRAVNPEKIGAVVEVLDRQHLRVEAAWPDPDRFRILERLRASALADFPDPADSVRANEAGSLGLEAWREYEAAAGALASTLPAPLSQLYRLGREVTRVLYPTYADRDPTTGAVADSEPVVRSRRLGPGGPRVLCRGHPPRACLRQRSRVRVLDGGTVRERNRTTSAH